MLMNGKSCLTPILLPKYLCQMIVTGLYEGCSKSTRKSAIMFLFCKSAELILYIYIDKHNLYLYSNFGCSGMNTRLTVVAMETVHRDYRPSFAHFYKKSMFNDGVAFNSLPCYFHLCMNKV